MTTTTTTNATDLELKPLTDDTIATLMQVTQDPIDGMKLAADLYAMCAYAAEQSVAEPLALAIRVRRSQPRSSYGASSRI